MLNQLKRYVSDFLPSKQQTKKRAELGSSQKKLIKGVEDKFMPAKLQAFIYLLMEHELFQTRYPT